MRKHDVKPEIALPRPSSMALDPATVDAGGSVQCTVTMSGRSMENQNLTISTDVPADFASLPSQVTVLAGLLDVRFTAVTASGVEGTPYVKASTPQGDASATLTIE